MLETYNRFHDLADTLNWVGNGFTVDPQTGHDICIGYAVSIAPRCDRIYEGPISALDIFAYVAEMCTELSRKGAALGAWRDPKTENVYLDVSTVVYSRKRAIQIGHEFNQQAVFDLATCETIPVPTQDWSNTK